MSNQPKQTKLEVLQSMIEANLVGFKNSIEFLLAIVDKEVTLGDELKRIFILNQMFSEAIQEKQEEFKVEHNELIQELLDEMQEKRKKSPVKNEA